MSPSFRREGPGRSACFVYVALLLSMAAKVGSALRTPPICQMGECSCTKHREDESISTLTCNGVNLSRIPNLDLFPNLTQLDLQDNHIGTIRASDFDACRDRLILIDLMNNHLHTIEEGALGNLPELKHLILANNNLTSVPAEVFHGKTEMFTLDLAHNFLTDIPEGFASVAKYRRVELNDNPLGNLRDAVFIGNLTTITTFDLSNIGMTYLDPFRVGYYRLKTTKLFLNGNYFPVVKWGMFEGLPFFLEELGLRFCGIQEIKRGAFREIPKLRSLYLDGNNMSLLQKRPFEGLVLQELNLANSNITDIRKTAFNDLSTIQLYLQDNNIGVINKLEFKDLRGVEILDLSNCSIRDIKGTPFATLGSLDVLILWNNLLTDGSVDDALRRHPRLRTLNLAGNFLTTFPNMPVSRFPKLQRVFLEHNEITSLTRKNLANMSELTDLHLHHNPLEGFAEVDDTFADSPLVSVLLLDFTLLTRLPNVTYLPHLIELKVNHARLNFLPKDICCSCTLLALLEAEDNHLTSLPTLSCRHMSILDLGHNRLTELHKDLLKGMKHIRALDLKENSILELDQDFFARSIDMEYLDIGGNQLSSLPSLTGMPHLIKLNASHNRLTRIPNGTFSEQVLMDDLYLNNNDIEYIDPLAFPVPNDLKFLNLSRNGRMKEWEIPKGGFPELATLYLEEMFNLHQIPHSKQLPLIRDMYLTYSYHCCFYGQEVGLLQQDPVVGVEGDNGSVIVILPTEPTPVTPKPLTEDCNQIVIDFMKNFPGLRPIVNPLTCEIIRIEIIDSETTTGDEVLAGGIDLETLQEVMKDAVEFMSSRTGFDYQVIYRDTVRCVPHENPLSPCQYLLDPWVLKVAVWAVWVLALLGNGTVLFIGIATRETLDSNELLICNLAFADFCMGVYLAFLAIVDVRTFGSSFYQSALDWQLGPGCQAAGFIAIFSSELSIYVLVVLTLERVYTLSHTFDQNERRRKRVVILLCVVGLAVASGLALMPIFGVNSYNRVAVCLPYLTERALDKAYIGLILTINLVGFVIILSSYIYIFWVVCKNAPSSNLAQRRKDMLVAATKIAVVIVTAFLCWAPIAVIGYLALFDVHLVDAKEAKYFIVFVYPLNACVNPFIYAIFTKRFRAKLGSIFRRSKSRVTSFPPGHHMRLHRIPSAFTSEAQITKVNSSSPTGTSRQEELTRLRQSRRSSSLVVQMVDTNLNTPSPTTFNPPTGCNFGRRASLPPGFGSTLNMAGDDADCQSNSNLPHYSILPLRLGSVYSSNNSSLPNLQEESATDLENETVFCGGTLEDEEERSNPLTSSQESNLRRLSVVKEEESEEAIVVACCGGGTGPNGGDEVFIAAGVGGDETGPPNDESATDGDDGRNGCDQDATTNDNLSSSSEEEEEEDSSSSSEEYLDASSESMLDSVLSDSAHSLEETGTSSGARGTDLDHMMLHAGVPHHRGTPPNSPPPPRRHLVDQDPTRASCGLYPPPAANGRIKAHSCENVHRLYSLEPPEDVDSRGFISSPSEHLLGYGKRRRSLEHLFRIHVSSSSLHASKAGSYKRLDDHSEKGFNAHSASYKRLVSDRDGSISPPNSHAPCDHHGDVSRSNGGVTATEGCVRPNEDSSQQQQQTSESQQLHHHSPVSYLVTAHKHPHGNPPNLHGNRPPASTHTPNTPCIAQQISMRNTSPVEVEPRQSSYSLARETDV